MGREKKNTRKPPTDRIRMSHVERPPRCSSADVSGIVVIEVLPVVVVLVWVVVVIVVEELLAEFVFSR